MKVLWFSNCAIANTYSYGSGSWLFGMKSIIANDVELYNITISDVGEIVKKKSDGIIEYLLPDYALHNGIPSKTHIVQIQRIVKEISPDLIHIWGMERYWARLYQQGYLLRYPAILEIQGVLSSLCKVFYGGLLPKEIVKMYGFREMFRPWDRLDRQYKRNVERSKDEALVISSFSYISTQSQWTRNQIKLHTSADCKIFETFRPIRTEFYLSSKWEHKNKKAPELYTSVSYNAPFKGLHILIRAMSFIVKKYPTAKLVIAGFNPNKPFYKDNGYNRYIKSLIKEFGLVDNIIFPGKLDAKTIIDYLLGSDVFINPSFVESYSAAAAEALFLGVPSVLSYAGALPNFSAKEDIALYYSPMDYIDCAAKIIELFEKKEESVLFSNKAISIMSRMCSREMVLETQMQIYRYVLSNCQ